ncbi:hypothetical protein DY245_29700 [Streptomyces inhibens]|uniref:Resolvase/invertase-type recombinase catalytic domain-containing protein n=1 Tax=Streptomyces inhibens TaxID=2293571 RepID=A0A371PWW4_STRIH|nr:hypothetical protein DY245_29700 [Streptomyces inhibens]
MIFYDLDRLARQPRNLEDLIDIVKYVERPVTGGTGGRMNLINDSDRHKARMMYVMALKPSKDTAHRVARQHLTAAQNGLAQGRIAYGWIRKGEHKGSSSRTRPTSSSESSRTSRRGNRPTASPGPSTPKGSSLLPPAHVHPRWSPRCSAIRATRAWSPTRGNIGSKPLPAGTAGHWPSSMTRDAPCSGRGTPSSPPSTGPRSSSSGNAAARRPESSPARPAPHRSTSTFSPESCGAANAIEVWWDTATGVSQER